MAIQYQPASVQTLYGDLLQAVLASEMNRSIGHLAATFVRKNVRTRDYWYLQYNNLGKKVQEYLGPDSAVLQAVIKRFELEKQKITPDVSMRSTLIRMIVQGGGVQADNLSAKILHHLAGGGLFKANAVLVGSHAFICYANMLGVNWRQGTHTHDIDLAYDKNMAVVIQNQPNINLPTLIDNAEMGFHPVPGFSHKQASTSFKMRGKEICVDILTPLVGPDKSGPIFLQALGMAAEPLRYLDYLVEDTESAVVLFGEGVLVNVPTPARYFWHKLIIMQERSSIWKIKIQKDRAQCVQLLEVLIDLRLSDLKIAWVALGKKNKKWQTYAKKGLKLILEKRDDLKQKLSKIIPY